MAYFHIVSLRLNDQSDQELVLAFLAESGDEYTSGEALSGKLGLSRAAVFKSVEALRLQGYRIDAVPARGYRLVELPDRLSSLELSPFLGTHDLGRNSVYLPVVDSTNAEAFRLASSGAPHGFVVIAESQTEGRGRRGRTWASPASLNLYCSFILRPDLPLSRVPELTLVTAVAVTECLRDLGIHPTLKWPNDVRVKHRKLAGILTELSTDGDRAAFVVVGLGVNLNALRTDFPAEIADVVTSVREELGERVARPAVTGSLLTRIEEWMDLHEEVGFAPVRTAWKEMSQTLGQSVSIRTERGEWVGKAEDIDETGALLVRTPSGNVERVLAGDVEQVST